MRAIRVYPWLLEAKQRGREVGYMFDCNRCQKETGKAIRQSIGCGWEQQDDRIPPTPWDGQSLGRIPYPDEYDEQRRMHLPVCPGYACSLPEFVEISHAYFFLGKGGLLQFTGEAPTPPMLTAMIEFEREAAAVMQWSSKNPEKK